MSDRHQVAVLGLGRFGRALARELTRLGHEVLAVDTDERLVQAIAEDVTQAVQADFTDEDALHELGLSDFDAVIVAVSSDLEVSILATVLLQRVGVRYILARAASDLHQSILERLGVHRVVHLEHEMGVRVAHSLAAPGMLDYFDVAPGYGFARVSVTEPLTDTALGVLDLQGRYGLTPLALHRGDSVILNPDASEVLRASDELVVAGRDADLQRLQSAATAERPTPPRGG